MINDNKTHYRATITANNISTIAELLQKITIKTMGINCKVKVLSPMLSKTALSDIENDIKRDTKDTMNGCICKTFGTITDYNNVDDILAKLFSVYNTKTIKVSNETMEKIKSIKIMLTYTDINFETQRLTKKSLVILPKIYNGEVQTDVIELAHTDLNFTVSNIKAENSNLMIYSKEDALNNLEYYFKPEALEDTVKLKYNLSHMNNTVYTDSMQFKLKSGCRLGDFNKI